MDQAFRMEAGRDGSDIAIRWQLEDGYYLYREYLSVTGVGGKPLEMATPPGVIKEDPGYGSTEVYYGTATATVAGPVTGSLNVTYQGCQDGGLCYPPTTVEIDAATLEPKSDTGKSGLQTALRSQAAFPLVSKGPKAADSSSIRISDPSTNGVVSSLLDRGGVLFLIVGFLGLGVLLAFTPCVFPMYPILAATLTREGESLSTGRGFALSSTYVLALAAAFSLFGVVAAWWGQSFQIALQSPAATLIVAAIFVALALSSFGLFELQLPSFLRNRLTARRGSGGSLASSAALGFSSALVIGPCVTAPLAGALLYIAQTGDVVLGATALFALGVGKGIPLILMGTFGSGLLPRAGQWMERVRQVFGFLFFATAVWLVDRLLPAGTGLLLWSVLAITFAVFIGAFDQMRPEVGGAARLAKSAGILVGLYGVILGIGGLSGATDPLKPLATIAAASSGDATPARVIGKDSFQSIASAADLSSLLRADGPAAPTLVYFTADWCVTCRVIERSVLPDATVADALDGIRLVSVDLSEITEANQSLMKELQVVGPPTMLFLDRDNQEVQDTRLVGEITADTVTVSASSAKGQLR
ncbi:protein-disulfide reductase DsbD [Sinorhizobium medicae]|jgi:thiol:disulfide interchange protein DsbD|nr:protein-disulfide reductase DsbD [Sinorhizobium medicae]NSY51652.1 protein-disulfide reductase DsbD [Agrobacterium tumefaciens]NTA45915.1 protein-disulfide reductase DsbD [Agrobacterium tumefaciens]TZG31570.1 protein-disulfide reductase DsbD [Agrobacterium sp. B1(2019)]UXT85303.1 protein-disulfide reductase DsbD [Agrobacterium tumefaciens]